MSPLSVGRTAANASAAAHRASTATLSMAAYIEPTIKNHIWRSAASFAAYRDYSTGIGLQGKVPCEVMPVSLSL
jgi:hypothetical protein